jgi:trimeric autotransporter adhesin
VSSLPYGVVTSPPYTDNAAADPVHSCTGSSDHNSAWWLVTAPNDGAIQIEEYGYAVVSAYAMGTTPQLGNELACLDGTSLFLGTTGFEVTAGTSYLIEESLRTADTVFTRGIAFRMLPPIRISISPSAPAVAPGQAVQLNAAVAATSNTAVRWSLSPPVGIISSTGLYTAPANPKVSQVTVTASSMQDPTENSSVTVNISGAPASPINVSAAGVTNAATFAAGPVAPGEIITIFGAGYGPATLAGLTVNSVGRVSSAIGTTPVTFDGVPAPLIYAISGQLSAVVPYEVAGQSSTAMLITDSGNFSQSVTLPVASAAPAFFTLNQSGSGQVAMINQDGSINGPGHPAPKGSVVTIYGTGEGITAPASSDGQVNSSVYPKPVQPGSVAVGGQRAALAYLGAAPGFVAGVLQVNVTVPANAPSGNAVPIVLTIGTNSSPATATMAVQ